MALHLSPPPPLTLFSPPTPTPRTPPTELRFSRWNNANAEPFTQKYRAQKEIEDEIRRTRRFDSATKIIENYNSTPHPTTTAINDNFKSIGTPSQPSQPSIPGKKSKYSKPPHSQTYKNQNFTHPAFSKVFKSPKVSITRLPSEPLTGVQVGEIGVTYNVPNAPFVFQYSYTETPKAKPLALREAPFAPFGPATMARPWTGRAPLSKKKLPEFDSFKLPPPGKKGVKPVQSPGPFLAGMGPKYVKSREEVLGEPLTEEEVKELVEGCLKTRRQLNMGRDGLTHNMLDNIHAHWKRRRVCKIKCKGVCTVDMDNVREQLEEKTGGKIIFSRGGALFLFRGRNYNYRSRPRFPLMLWKPISPVYPRLIQQVPEGLTLEEAKEMRKKGREIPPICKLGKNGVYNGLVNHVREAFEECELVRVECKGMNGSDYKKIGAKLKDLVPCVLVSFEYEHILMWRGQDWKSSLPNSKDFGTSAVDVNPSGGVGSVSVEQDDTLSLFAQNSSNDDTILKLPKANMLSSDGEGRNFIANMDIIVSPSEAQPSVATSMVSSLGESDVSSIISDSIGSKNDEPVNFTPLPTVFKSSNAHNESEATSAAPEHVNGIDPAPDGVISHDDLQESSEDSRSLSRVAASSSRCTEGVILLQKKAVDSGHALLLDDASFDADIVFKRSVAFANNAPPGPIFRNSVNKVVLVRRLVKKENADLEDKEVTTVKTEATKKRSFMNQRIKDFKELYSDTLPYGSLGVDELAKLLG